jgi:hypothetical protein
MGLHDVHLGRREPARLEQNAVGYSDLADVVQGRRFGQQGDVALGEEVGKARVPAQPQRQSMDVALRSVNVIAGLRIANLGQVGQCPDADGLGGLVFLHAAINLGLQREVVGLQPIACLLQFKLGVHARQHDRRHDRFGDVVHGAEAKPVQLVLLAVQRGDEDDRDATRGRIGL